MELYLWVKAFHVVAVIAWLAGMLYLPRLFVYHCAAAPGSELSETLKVMERRLLRAIVNPAMIAAFVFGGILLWQRSPGIWSEGWLHAKLAGVLALAALHGFFARWRRHFAEDDNRHTRRFYRIMNEVPAALMVLIVVMVIVRPF